MGTPTKIKETFTPSNLEDNYREELCNILPILNHEGLLGLVIDYCNELKFYEKSNKESHIKTSILNKISEKLKNLRKEAINISKKNPSLHIKKIEEINVTGLIEAIIQITIKYYSNNITVALSGLNINNEFMYISMNKVNEKKNLTEYILNLYNNNEKSIIDKNNDFINILKRIAEKLKFLQDECGFIHGDFHADNILIDKNDNIIFIDFEYSVIRLPTKNNNQDIILCGTKSVNLERKDIFNIKENPNLKAIDFFHLIIYINNFKNNKNTYNYLLEEIMAKIYNVCFNEKINLLNFIKYKENPHKFTSSYNFIKQSNNLKNLYPESIINLEFNSNGTLYIEDMQPVQPPLLIYPNLLNKKESSPKRSSEFNNNSPKKFRKKTNRSNENNKSNENNNLNYNYNYFSRF